MMGQPGWSLLCCLLLVGCAVYSNSNDAPDSIELRAEPDPVPAGAEILLTLTNRSEHELGYNLCPAVLDRRVDGEWVEVPERPAEICTMELRALDPAASATYRHTVPAELAPGEYRFRVAVEWPLGDRSVSVASHGFRIIR